ncbi:MAG: von Willebrand factor type A domain-containing protein [Marinoscillum sp.]
MQKLLFLFSLAIASIVEAAPIKITGTVYDESGSPIPGVTVSEVKTSNGTITDLNGHYKLEVKNEQSGLSFSFIGYNTLTENVGKRRKIDVILSADVQALEEVVAKKLRGMVRGVASSPSFAASHVVNDLEDNFNTEEYDGIEENIFHTSASKPLSTFSIDVDATSYSNMRRFLNMGQLPPKDAVRIEEMINYFNYEYDGPANDQPFAIHTAKSKAPWNDQHLLVKIGIQGKKLEMDQLPPSNIVFLLDVSGSMNAPNKLPLLKSSIKMLVNELRPEDKISIVVYAGAAGLVLPPTDGNEKKKILEAIENLQAGGSTAGGAGIQLAYKVAQEHLVKGGNNRVILATDGDFNVGASSNGEMQRLIEEKREGGVFLTVLGFGMGNYKDSKMETLADKGNGNYAYIDNIMEAKKVLVTEFGGTLFTIAKDVKIQVEFNPNVVQAYRLIGYENRQLKSEDFNDDKKDAGELGSGHTVTALYEIIPQGVDSEFVKDIDELKYQNTKITGNTDELLTVKFRYKEPNGNKSKLLSKTLPNDQEMDDDQNLKWAAAVAGFGMVLRDSEFKGNLTYNEIVIQAKNAAGNDDFGYRSEFINLVEIAGRIQ